MTAESPPTPEPVADVVAARRHLDVVWHAGLPPGTLLSTFSKKGGSHQYLDFDEAARDLCAQPDCYLACAAFEQVSRGKRGKEENVRATAGFAIDVDLLGGKHAQSKLPTEEEALALLKEAPIPPNYVLHSGGGLYAWLLLTQPLLITDKDSLRLAKMLSKAWHRSITDLALQRGWVLDITADLPRCLRAPGTLNAKYTPPRLVRVVSPVDGAEIQRVALDDVKARFVVSAKSKRSTPINVSVPTLSGGVPEWLKLAGDLVGGCQKLLEKEEAVVAVVLLTCPACLGRESDGAVARGTAHIARMSGVLRCKRASCEAHEGLGGLPLETWSSRYLLAADRAQMMQLRAADRAARPALTDDGNALRLVRRHGRDLRWCGELGWMHWDSRRFVCAETTAVALARDTARAIADELEGVEDPDEREAIAKHWQRSQNEARIRAMLSLARTDVAVQASELDASPYLLCVANGTIDLRSGTLRAHARGDLITKLADTVFDPDARSDDLERFLSALTGGDVEFLAHLLRLGGYSLVGDKSVDVVPFMLGGGGTGKTTYLEAQAATLGEYAATIPFEALLAQQRPSAGPAPELVKLRGARFVKAVEAPEGAQLNAALLKAIAGGDLISCRDLYKTPLTFRPTFTIWLAANSAPRINVADSGARRRLIILPCDHVVPDDRIDAGLRERLRAPQARSALLALLVRGAVAWQQQGLGTSAAVERATVKFWEGATVADLLPRFFAEHCVRDDAAWTATAAIRERLDSYARELGAKLPSDKALVGFLRGARCVEDRKARARGWRGIRLVERTPEPGDGSDSADESPGANDTSDGMTPPEPSSLYTSTFSPSSTPSDTRPDSPSATSYRRQGVTGVIDPDVGEVGEL